MALLLDGITRFCEDPSGFTRTGEVCVEPLTVLVVEDNDKSRKLFEALLDLNGYRTVSARTMADAVSVAIAGQPAVVLMDIQLPDGDGVQALRQLRADARTAAIPVIAVTAFAMPGDRERLLQAGFNGYITKPIDANRFVAQIATVLSAESHPSRGGDGPPIGG